MGFSPIDAELRFTFGNMYLLGGLGMVVVLTGIFAVSQLDSAVADGFVDQGALQSTLVKIFGGGQFDQIAFQLQRVILVAAGAGAATGAQHNCQQQRCNGKSEFLHEMVLLSK